MDTDENLNRAQLTGFETREWRVSIQNVDCPDCHSAYLRVECSTHGVIHSYLTPNEALDAQALHLMNHLHLQTPQLASEGEPVRPAR